MRKEKQVIIYACSYEEGQGCAFLYSLHLLVLRTAPRRSLMLEGADESSCSMSQQAWHGVY